MARWENVTKDLDEEALVGHFRKVDSVTLEDKVRAEKMTNNKTQ